MTTITTTNTKLATAASRKLARAEGKLRGLRFLLADRQAGLPSDALLALAGLLDRELDPIRHEILRLESELPALQERHDCYAEPLPAWLDRVRVEAWGPSPLPNAYKYRGPVRDCGVTVSLLPGRPGGKKRTFAEGSTTIETPKRPYGRGDCSETFLAAVAGEEGRRMARAIRGRWSEKRPLERRRVVADLLAKLGVAVRARGPRPSKEEV